MTIRQLLSSEPAADDLVLLDHKPLRHVRFVGVVRGVTDSDTGSRFRIEDGTGMVDARLYSSGAGTSAENFVTDHDGEENSDQPIDKEEKGNASLIDRYVSVFARVSISNDRHNIAINDIRLIEDPNEVAYHMLNAIHHHVANVGGFVGQQGGNSAITAYAGANTGSGSANSLFVGGTGAIAANARGAGNLGDRILDYLRRFESLDSGVHIQSLVQGLGSDYSTIKEALEALNEDGFIYNPDDDHYAITPQN